MSELIFSSKANKDFGHSNLGIKRRCSPVWLSQAGEAKAVWDSMGKASSGAVPTPGTRMGGYRGRWGVRKPYKLEKDSILSNTAWTIIFPADANPNLQTAEEMKSGWICSFSPFLKISKANILQTALCWPRWPGPVVSKINTPDLDLVSIRRLEKRPRN